MAVLTNMITPDARMTGLHEPRLSKRIPILVLVFEPPQSNCNSGPLGRGVVLDEYILKSFKIKVTSQSAGIVKVLEKATVLVSNV